MPPRLAILPFWDRFEDFYDQLGVSLADYRYLTGDWLFNYIDALHSVGVDSVIYFASARVAKTVRFRHESTGATVTVLPTPRLNLTVRNLRARHAPRSRTLLALGTYAATPLGLLAREIQRTGCGAILCQEYMYARFDVAVLLGRLIGLPVFATYQGGNSQLSRWELWVRHFSMRACAGLIIANADELHRVLAAYRMPPRKLAHVPNPTDFARWEPNDRQAARVQLGLPVDARILIWHGRVEVERKGLDVLLDAWDQLTRASPRARLVLVLVGAGRDASELRRLLDQDPRSEVIWIDRYIQDRAGLWAYLSAADAYVLPSRHEGFAVAPLEAMACGLPVVAAAVAGVPDMLGSGDEAAGIVVPIGDAEALAEGLRRIMLSPELGAALGARGYERARAVYSPAAVGAQLRAFMSARGAFRSYAG